MELGCSTILYGSFDLDTALDGIRRAGDLALEGVQAIVEETWRWMDARRRGAGWQFRCRRHCMTVIAGQGTGSGEGECSTPMPPAHSARRHLRIGG